MSHLHVSVHFNHFPSTLNEPVQVRFIVAGCLDNKRFITKALESVLNDSCDVTLTFTITMFCTFSMISSIKLS